MQGHQPPPYAGVILILFIFAFAWVMFSMVWRIIRHHRKGIKFPKLSTEQVRYHEDFASGYSDRYRLGFLKGGTSRCLRITVTDEEVWMRTFFPFTAFALDFDLEHRIPKSAIVALQEVPGLFRPAIELKFRDSSGVLHNIQLYVNQPAKFLHAIQPQTAGTPPPLPA
jgi:hypothetical protein